MVFAANSISSVDGCLGPNIMSREIDDNGLDLRE